MATPIVGLASQIFASGIETVQVTGGTQQTLATTRYYYFVSNRTATSNGQSLLKAIKDMLDTSLADTVWTVALTAVSGLYRIQISHNGGGARTLTMAPQFALDLGFALGAEVQVIAAGATATADYPAVWWWTPNQTINVTGPELFDPSISYGIPSSAGFSQRAPDMTTAYVTNGVQWEARYQWLMVNPGYLTRANTTYSQRSFETWWRNGPSAGRRFLMWRDRANATGSNAPSRGSSTPWRYIEYAPQETLRSTLTAKATPGAGTNPNLYDVSLDCWITENGETPLTD